MPLAPGVSYDGVKLNQEQVSVATTIYNVGRNLGANDRDIQSAWTAGWVESNFRNLNYGDRDSLGVFQQRAPWGSVAQRTNVAEASRMFFQGGHGGQPGLFDITNRNTMSIGQAAQAVQRSAFPGKYDQYVGMSAAMLQAMGGVPGAPTGDGSGSSDDGGFFDAIGDAISFITNPGNWLRVGLFLFGMFLLAFGGAKLIGKSEAIQDGIKMGVEAVALKGKA